MCMYLGLSDGPLIFLLQLRKWFQSSLKQGSVCRNLGYVEYVPSICDKYLPFVQNSLQNKFLDYGLAFHVHSVHIDSLCVTARLEIVPVHQLSLSAGH